MICKTCGRELPEDRFEMTSTGYRRHMCRQCRWALVQKPYLERRKRDYLSVVYTMLK